ncbi:MAG: FxLYD domain-containing protein, partial [Phycisphaerae bacterium]|nr:FxLYD domain-containing protein [Phycisphaerae bacterium]
KSEPKFGETSHGPTVVVMGEIKNISNLSWKDVQLEVRFYDKDNNLIDTDQKEKYSFVVPANDISTFKVSIPREFPEEQYASCKVRILSAQDSRTMW